MMSWLNKDVPLLEGGREESQSNLPLLPAAAKQCSLPGTACSDAEDEFLNRESIAASDKQWHDPPQGRASSRGARWLHTFPKNHHVVPIGIIVGHHGGLLVIVFEVELARQVVMGQ